MRKKQLEIPYTAFNEILNSKRLVTTDFALLIEAALGVSSGLLLRLQADYNLQVAKKNSKLLSRLAKISKIAAVF